MIKVELKGEAWKFKGARMKLTRSIMREVGDVAAEGNKNRLDRGLGVDESGQETRLVPLSALTVGRKGSSIPLVDTGGMKDSFQVDSGKLTDTRVVIAFSPEQALKAAVHQRGAVIQVRNAKALRIPVGPKRGAGKSGAAIFRKRAVIPARPHVGPSTQDREDIIDVLAARMRTALKAS